MKSGGGGCVVGDLESKDVSASNWVKVEVEVKAELGNTEKYFFVWVGVAGGFSVKAISISN